MKKRKIQYSSLGMLISLLLLAGCGTIQTEDEAVDAKEVSESVSEIETEVAAGLIFDLPDGFTAKEDTYGFYKSEEYEEDYACIYYQHAILVCAEYILVVHISAILDLYTEITCPARCPSANAIIRIVSVAYYQISVVVINV